MRSGGSVSDTDSRLVVNGTYSDNSENGRDCSRAKDIDRSIDGESGHRGLDEEKPVEDAGDQHPLGRHHHFMTTAQPLQESKKMAFHTR